MNALTRKSTHLIQRALGAATGRLQYLPVLTLIPHGACNCRCVMCDIWKANREARTLSRDQLGRHVADMKALGVRRIVLSGGEALMHPNLWSLCELLGGLPARITLLSTGLLLARHAAEVVRWCDDVIVSLDGSPAVHDAIRNVPGAYEKLAAGIGALRKAKPSFAVSGRCVIQRLNFRDLTGIIDTAKKAGLDSISFLAADVSSTAFNRPQGWPQSRQAEVALSPEEVDILELTLESAIQARAADFSSGFVLESPAKLRRIVAYFRSIVGDGAPPPVRCNAPWVSAVVEADGRVRPCFFHDAYGSLDDGPLDTVINSAAAIAFRRRLNVNTDPVCQKCVCSLKLGPLARI